MRSGASRSGVSGGRLALRGAVAAAALFGGWLVYRARAGGVGDPDLRALLGWAPAFLHAVFFCLLLSFWEVGRGAILREALAVFLISTALEALQLVEGFPYAGVYSWWDIAATAAGCLFAVFLLLSTSPAAFSAGGRRA